VVRLFPKVEEDVDDALLLIASGARRPEDIAYIGMSFLNLRLNQGQRIR